MRATALILLGCCLLIGTPAPAAGASTTVGAPRVFAETGHTLAYGFHAFWEQHGELPILGYPLTEVFLEAGRPVQYFERARLEWHGEGALVRAGHLGRWAAARATAHPAFGPAASRA